MTKADKIKELEKDVEYWMQKYDKALYTIEVLKDENRQLRETQAIQRQIILNR